jgi:hypothetical protein
MRPRHHYSAELIFKQKAGNTEGPSEYDLAIRRTGLCLEI